MNLEKKFKEIRELSCNMFKSKLVKRGKDTGTIYMKIPLKLRRRHKLKSQKITLLAQKRKNKLYFIVEAKLK